MLWVNVSEPGALCHMGLCLYIIYYKDGAGELQIDVFVFFSLLIHPQILSPLINEMFVFLFTHPNHITHLIT